jgi:hypothetical protein
MQPCIILLFLCMMWVIRLLDEAFQIQFISVCIFLGRVKDTKLVNFRRLFVWIGSGTTEQYTFFNNNF